MNDFKTVLHFWFEEAKPDQWWKKDPAFDSEISHRFGVLYRRAKAGELFQWRDSPKGALAEIIILDQFSRNMFRNLPESFASDALALFLAQNAIKAEFDKKLSESERAFMYMPFMHSESPYIHEIALKLFEQLGNSNHLAYEIQHKKIIDRFGRYPHRNKILNRVSTADELSFLQEAGSSF